MNHLGQPFCILELPLAISKLLFRLCFSAILFKAKRKGVRLKKHHILFTASCTGEPLEQRAALQGTPSQGPVSRLDILQRGGNVKPSSSNSQAIVQRNILTEKRITAPLLHCHTYKVTCLYATTGAAKQVFWFSSILNTLFGGISDSINSEAARSQG